MIAKKTMFIGREVEGRDYLGVKTLFVPCGSISSACQPYEVMAKENITRAYYGAGNSRGIDPLEVESIDVILQSGIVVDEIVLEVDGIWQVKRLPAHLLKTVKVVYVISQKTEPSLSSLSAIKIVDEEWVCWIDIKGSYFTPINHKEYFLDREVEA